MRPLRRAECCYGLYRRFRVLRHERSGRSDALVAGLSAGLAGPSCGAPGAANTIPRRHSMLCAPVALPRGQVARRRQLFCRHAAACSFRRFGHATACQLQSLTVAGMISPVRCRFSKHRKNGSWLSKSGPGVELHSLRGGSSKYPEGCRPSLLLLPLVVSCSSPNCSAEPISSSQGEGRRHHRAPFHYRDRRPGHRRRRPCACGYCARHSHPGPLQAQLRCQSRHC